MWREFERLYRRVLPLFPEAELPPIKKQELLREAHGIDTRVADMATALGVGGQDIQSVVEKAEKLMNDPEVRKIYYEELFDQKVEELGRGIDGFESFTLWAEAGRIVEERQRLQRGQS